MQIMLFKSLQAWFSDFKHKREKKHCYWDASLLSVSFTFHVLVKKSYGNISFQIFLYFSQLMSFFQSKMNSKCLLHQVSGCIWDRKLTYYIRLKNVCIPLHRLKHYSRPFCRKYSASAFTHTADHNKKSALQILEHNL